MLLESVWAPLDDFWSAQDSGVRGCSGSLEQEEEHVTEGGSCFWGCTRTLWNSREQKPQADCQVWHSASSFCSVCPPENTEWAELSGELLCSALLQKQTMEQLLELNLLAGQVGSTLPSYAPSQYPALGGQGDPPECSQCQQHPEAGQHCPKSWSCSQPEGSSPVPSPKQHLGFAVVWMLGNLWTVCPAPSATHLARCSIFCSLRTEQKRVGVFVSLLNWLLF